MQHHLKKCQIVCPGATFFIPNMIASTLEHPDEHQDSCTLTTSLNQCKSQSKANLPKKNKSVSVDNSLKQIKAHLSSLATALSTINDALNLSVQYIYCNLKSSYLCHLMVLTITCNTGHWPKLHVLCPLLFVFVNLLFWSLTRPPKITLLLLSS